MTEPHDPTTSPNSGGPDERNEGEQSHQPETGSSSGSTAANPAGGMRYQDPSTATARPPSLAEQRERDRVRREAEAAAWEQVRRDAADSEKRAKRQKHLIQGGIAVGLVGLVAVLYLAATDDGDYETAQCVDENKVVVDDKYCSTSQGSYGSSGMWLFFVGGNRYQYSYGSNAPVGQRANGSLTPDPGKSYANTSGRAVTSSGKTGSPVSRGGFGSSRGSTSSGSSVGG